MTSCPEVADGLVLPPIQHTAGMCIPMLHLIWSGETSIKSLQLVYYRTILIAMEILLPLMPTRQVEQQ